MEARFIILHPDDPAEILSATTLIRCLKSQVEEALVYPVVKESHRWLLESNPYLDELFVYQDNPKELLDQLKDFLPDYLIDLDGRRKVRRFKRRLKVLDFTINRKKSGDAWIKRAFDTCTLFDVEDDGRGPHYLPAQLDHELLPSEFSQGYLVLALDSLVPERPASEEQIINLVVMIEKPVVVTGGLADRNLANRISQSTGCAVFPTCGDLTHSQIGALLGQAKGVIVFDSIWNKLAAVLGIERMVIAGNIDSVQMKEMVIQSRSLFKTSHGRTTL